MSPSRQVIENQVKSACKRKPIPLYDFYLNQYPVFLPNQFYFSILTNFQSENVGMLRIVPSFNVPPNFTEFDSLLLMALNFELSSKR